MKRTGTIPLIALTIVAVLAGCANLQRSEPIHSTDALIAFLSEEGIQVQYMGARIMEDYSAPGQTFQVLSGGILAVFQYSDNTSAWMDAPRVERPMEDGMQFYHRENMIVLYTGNDPSVERVLALTMGSRVA